MPTVTPTLTTASQEEQIPRKDRVWHSVWGTVQNVHHVTCCVTLSQHRPELQSTKLQPIPILYRAEKLDI